MTRFLCINLSLALAAIVGCEVRIGRTVKTTTEREPQVMRVVEKDGKLLLPDGKRVITMKIGSRRILPGYYTRPHAKITNMEKEWQAGNPDIWKLEYDAGIEGEVQ